MAIIISLASLLPHRILNHQHKKNVWIISRTNGNAYATMNRWNSESRSQTCLDYAEISCKREQSQACLAMPRREGGRRSQTMFETRRAEQEAEGQTDVCRPCLCPQRVVQRLCNSGRGQRPRFYTLINGDGQASREVGDGGYGCQRLSWATTIDDAS